MNLNDKAVSYLRTFVPIVWGYVVTFVLGHIPAAKSLLDGLGIDPTSPLVVGGVVSVVTAAWYALMRWLEPKLPAWLTRIVLGSNSTPTYVEPPADDAADDDTLSADAEVTEGLGGDGVVPDTPVVEDADDEVVGDDNEKDEE